MRTEPVVTGGIVTGIASVITVVLVYLGFDAEGAAQIGAGVAAIITTVIAIWSIVSARSKVTPLTQPQNNDGVALVPETKAA